MPPKKNTAEDAVIVDDAPFSLSTLPVVIPPGTELAMLEDDDLASLILNEEDLNRRVDELTKAVRSTVIDISTGKGRDELRSYAMRVRKTKVAVEKVGKSSLTDLEDEKKRRKGIFEPVVKRLDELASEARQPLTDWEEAEEKRKQQIEDNMKMIEGWGKPDRAASIEDMEATLVELDEFVIDDKTMPGSVKHALDARDASRETLVRLIEEAKAAAAREEELRAEREENERLKRQLEEQQAAVEKAEREREAAAAKERAEREKAEREREAAERAEKIAGWKARITKISDMANVDLDDENLESVVERRIGFLTKINVTEDAYGEMQEEANDAIALAVKTLRDAVAPPAPEPAPPAPEPAPLPSATYIPADPPAPEPEPEPAPEPDEEAEANMERQDAAYQAMVSIISGADSADEAAFALLEAINAGEIPYVSIETEG